MKLTYFDRPHHDYSNTVATQQEHKSVQRKVCFINVFLIKHFEKTLQRDIDKKVF